MKHKRVKTHRMSPERDHATISRMSDRSTCHPPDHAHSSAAHPQCMDSSVVERLVYTELVGGSNPSPCTTFGKDEDGSELR